MAHHSEAVLVFDPDTDSGEMYGVGLELAGFRARVANSDAEALTVLRQEHPSAVIADLGAAAADGWDLIQLLRADRSTRDIPVVVLTGRTDPWIGRRAAELGCAALLVKPCLPDTLALVVRQSLDTL
jgi:CheY-like chemotaxis protein